MAINLKRMQEKLDATQKKGNLNDKNNKFFSLKDGVKTKIRLLCPEDGDPFKQFFFHYRLDSKGFLCPKKNFNEHCEACDLVSKLYKEKTEDGKKMAKDISAKERYYSAVYVRGEEAEGVRVFGYSQTVYKSFLQYVLDEEYGDITDPEKGVDMLLLKEQTSGKQFADTSVTAARNSSKLTDEGPSKAAELLKQIPDFNTLFARKSSDEVEKIVEAFLASDQTEEEAEQASTEIKKFGATPVAVKKPVKGKSEIDQAFDEMDLDA